jgi:peptide deformylase
MASRKDIVAHPKAILRDKSIRVRAVNEDTKKLIEKMINIGLDWEDHRDFEVCVGLAAVQIGELKKIIILRTDETEKREFEVLINPKIVKTYKETEYGFEGCLSVKDVYGLVSRYKKIKIQAVNEYGKEIRQIVNGFKARLIQHEIDHLQGILFVDLIEGDEEAFYQITSEGNIEKIDYDKVKAFGFFR